LEDKRVAEETKPPKPIKTSEKPVQQEKTKLTFREKQEFEGLEAEIQRLETEKEQLAQQLSSGNLSSEELINASNRISQVVSLIDEKTYRWTSYAREKLYILQKKEELLRSRNSHSRLCRNYLCHCHRSLEQTG
jgi:predicted RNase H-like nuclease (RuvC/YqgF family)